MAPTTRRSSRNVVPLETKGKLSKKATKAKDRKYAPTQKSQITKQPKKLLKLKEWHPNDDLAPRTNMTEYNKDPTFDSKEEIPFVSVSAYSKLAIRAVNTNNLALLKRLQSDVKHVTSLHLAQSVDVQKNALIYALEKGDWKMVDLLCADEQKPKQNRVESLKSLLETQGTGQANFHILGHATRRIQMTRGGKEGNNALTKPDALTYAINICVEGMLETGIDWNLLQKLVVKQYYTGNLSELIYVPIRNGHRKLAGALIKECGQYSFNELHHEVLLNDNQSLNQFRTVSVKKKGLGNRSLTPMHCACINPNPKYLQELMVAEPDFNHADEDGWHSTHYAAVCEGPKPLELLLSKGASVFDVDNQRNTPLHQAARTGRVKNVEVLVREIEARDPEMGALNLKNRESYAPIHLAAIHGHLEVIEDLLAAGADSELQTSAGRGKLDALMYACQQGHLDLIKYLIEKHNCIVNKRDKLKRTPLVHACLNGHASVASYLLRIGADPDLPDSSGNTAAHYAAAYGWYFCLKVLAEAGADLNKGNDWQLSPLAVAYMKGHMGLADYLLDQANMQINCQDDKGMTLVALTINAGITDSTQEQLSYLLKDKKASNTIPDSLGNTPLHMLAAVGTQLTKPRATQMDHIQRRKEEVKLQTNAAELLIKCGCDPMAKNDSGKTALILAIEAGNIELAEYFTEKGCTIRTDEAPIDGIENILHVLVARSETTDLRKDFQEWRKLMEATNFSTNAAPLFRKMARNEPNCVSELLNLTDLHGHTPFLLACKIYSEILNATEGDGVFDGMRELIIAMIEFAPECIRHVVQQKKKELDYEEECEDEEDKKLKRMPEGLTCFHLALKSNPYEEITENGSKRPLLSTIINHVRSGSHHLDVIEQRNDDGNSALMAAVSKGDVDASEILIKAGANVNFTTRNKDSAQKPTQVTVLMEAIKLQMTSTAKLLISYQANVNAKDSEDNTAMHYAAQHPTSLMAEVMDELLRHGAQLAALNNKKRTPLHILCNSDSGEVDASTDSVELVLNSASNLIDSGALSKDIRGRIPLHYLFVKIGNHKDSSVIDPIALCSLFMHRMESQPEFLNLPDNFKQTPLHCAVKRGSNICCMTLIRHATVDVNAKDMLSNTPLGNAVDNRHKDCALTLLQAHASIDATITKQSSMTMEEYEKKNKWKWIPLRGAAPKTEKISIVSAVVSNEWQEMLYVIMDLLPKDFDTIYWFTSAAIEQCKYNLALTIMRILKGLMSPEDQSIKKPPPQENNNLFRVLARSALPDHQNNLQIRVADALTGLGLKWWSKLETNSKITIECHPLIDAIKKHNFTLIECFKANSNWDEIIGNCSTEENNPFTALFEGNLNNLTDAKWVNLMKELLEIFKANERNIQELVDQTLLFEKSADTTDLLGRPNPTITSSHFITPLIRAIVAQKFNLVKFLLCTNHADSRVADDHGMTPLMHAICTNNEHITKLLLNNDYEIKDGQEETEDEEEEEEEEEEEQIEEIGRLFGKTQELGRSQYSDAQPDNHDDVETIPDSHKRKKEQVKSKSKKQKLTEQAEFKLSGNFLVDLKATDKNGRTVLHHCVQSMSWGGWSNVKLLKLLLKLGAPLEAKDKTGTTAQALAVQTGQFELVQVLNGEQKLTKSDATFSNSFHEVQQFKYDLEKDAATFLSSEAQKRKKHEKHLSKQAEKPKPRPHHLSNYQDTGEIVVDDDTRETCSVLLNNIELQYGKYAIYNFYRLQLIKRKGSRLYIVFTNWGRINDADYGQYQQTPFGNLQDALKEYCHIFWQKTGNDWTNIEDFQNVPYKYRLVQQSKGTDAMNLADVKFKLDFDIPSKTQPKHLQKLLADISDVKMLRNETRIVLTPFGRIEKSDLLKAQDVLLKIANNESDLAKMRKDVTHRRNFEKCIQLTQAVANLSQEFYQVIRLRRSQDSQLPVIEKRLLTEHHMVIENLLKLEVVGKILSAAAYRRNEVHPLEYIYESLETHLELLSPDGWESQAILHYMANSNTSVDVIGIYKVYQAPEKDKVKDFSPFNRRLLWHGTSAANLLSVFKLGLLWDTGNSFRKDLHTFDVFAKSIEDCQASCTGHRYALLCEVALGKIKKLYSVRNTEKIGTLPDSFDSVKAMGRKAPNKTYDVTLNSGAVFPLGVLESQGAPKNEYLGLDYNEYIVYKPEQIAIRYLVVFK